MVPSLLSICLLALSKYPQHAHLLSTPIYLSHIETLNHIIDDPANISPNLWLTLVQVLLNLPAYFQHYSLPWNHKDIPLFQSIKSTSNFSLTTLLDLSNCQQLTDTSIARLNQLHHLVALNISQTQITASGIRNLANTLRVDDDVHPTGPWSLRVAALRNCYALTDAVYTELLRFPLLTVVDLRGTKCSPNASFPFVSSTVDDYYHPSTLQDSVNYLQESYPETFSSSNTYFLHISGWDEPPKQVLVGTQNAFAVIPSNPQNKITVGNAVILDMCEQEQQAFLQHERNKDAWYRRQHVLESKGLPTPLDEVDFPSHPQPILQRPPQSRGYVGSSLSTSKQSEFYSSETSLPKAPNNLLSAVTARPNRAAIPPLSADNGASLRLSSSSSGITESPAASSSRDNAINIAGSSREGQARTHQPTSTLTPVPIVALQRTQMATADTFYARNRAVRTDSETPKSSSKRVGRARQFESLSDAKTRHLKLFREPPPYSALQGAIQQVVSARERFEQESVQKRRHREDVKAGKEKAVFDLNGEKAMGIRKSMESSLMGMVASRLNGGAAGDERTPKRRRVSDQSMPSFDYGAKPLVPKGSNNKKPNPFRRRSETPSTFTAPGFSRAVDEVDSADEEIDDGIEYSDDNVRGGGPLLTKIKGIADSRLPIMSSKPSDKRLKPISSIPIPILTPEMQREEWVKEAKALGITVEELKRIGFGWTPDKDTGKTPENDNNKRNSGAAVSRSMESKEFRLSSSARPVSTGENNRRKSTGGVNNITSSSSKNPKTKAGFDWSNWGKK